MAKKLAEIKQEIETSTDSFKSYLDQNVDKDIMRILHNIQFQSTVYVFSGVIRNFFLGINEVRDLDIVLSEKIDVDFFFKDHEIKKNSFGGYKIKCNNISLDIWFLDMSWAFRYQNHLNFEIAKYMPSTAFFNFSSITFNLNESTFYFTNHFARFIRDKEIDVVYKPNFNYELCVINSFYYSDKYHLRISERLQKYIMYLNTKIQAQSYDKVQLKHFGEILYTVDEISKRISNLKINEIKIEPSIFISYKKGINPQIFHAFKNYLKNNSIPVSSSRNNEEWENFTGSEIFDIVLFVKENIILAPAIYDIFKASVLGLLNRIYGSKKPEINSKKISIRFEDEKHRNVELNFDGKYNKVEIKTAIDEAMQFFTTTEKENKFKDRTYVDNSKMNSRIEMKFNPKTNKWEATNFEEIRKQWEDWKRQAEENFNG